MSGVMMMIIAIVVLGGAYLLYGRYLQNKWGIDPNAKTPAYEMGLVISSRRSPVRVRSMVRSRRQFLAGFRSCFGF